MHAQKYTMQRTPPACLKSRTAARGGSNVPSARSSATSPGDLSVAMESDISGSAYFRLAHYHGIRIRIDLDRAPRCLSCFLDDVEVSPQALRQKFCSGNTCFIARFK